MLGLKNKWKGLLLCLAIALPSWFLGKMFPIVGGAVIAIIAGRYGYSYPWELGKIIQIAAESTVSVMPSLIAAQCKAYNNRAPQGL